MSDLQGQSWRPQHLDTWKQEGPEIQDVEVAKQVVDVDKGLTIGPDGIDGIESALLVGIESGQGLDGTKRGVFVGHGHVSLSLSLGKGGLFQAAVSGIVSLLADRGE